MPASAYVALHRAQSIIGNGGRYWLGTGDYRPREMPGGIVDLPWTERDGIEDGCDCAGFICWAYQITRSRPGYNRGGRFDVEDDVNTNSMLGDAMGARELFALADGAPQPGDVIAWPTFELRHGDGSLIVDASGKPLRWIGHCGLVTGVERIPDSWDPAAPAWHYADIAQCCGPNGRRPGVIATDGSVFGRHDEVWPKPEHCCHLLRPV